MNILVAFKVVPDDQDIQVAGDRSLDYSKAKNTVSTYDLNAFETAAQLASDGDRVCAITVGPASIDEAKLKKNVLARGAEELFMVADDSCSDLDAYATAGQLASLVGTVGGFDLIVCGDGSADNYAQQVDVQLATRLGLPVVNAVRRLELADGAIIAERMLEDEIETVKVPLPAVVSVMPDIAIPRIPGMKDILSAGKKPMNVSVSSADVERTLETVSCLAPEQADRTLTIFDASEDGAIEKFAAALKAAL